MEEKSFEELYNESLNEKRFDKTVTGTVIGISSKGEIFVDFGYKADGIIPKSEYSDDETKNPKDEFKTGDEITADILKWNDGLGNVLLSYKKLKRREDAIKDTADQDAVRNRDEYFAKQHEQFQNYSRKLHDLIREINPSAYIVAEITISLPSLSCLVILTEAISVTGFAKTHNVAKKLTNKIANNED